MFVQQWYQPWKHCRRRCDAWSWREFRQRGTSRISLRLFDIRRVLLRRENRITAHKRIALHRGKVKVFAQQVLICCHYNWKVQYCTKSVCTKLSLFLFLAELVSKLHSAETRYSLLEKQIDYMRKMVECAARERITHTDKQVSRPTKAQELVHYIPNIILYCAL